MQSRYICLLSTVQMGTYIREGLSVNQFLFCASLCAQCRASWQQHTFYNLHLYAKIVLLSCPKICPETSLYRLHCIISVKGFQTEDKFEGECAEEKCKGKCACCVLFATNSFSTLSLRKYKTQKLLLAKLDDKIYSRVREQFSIVLPIGFHFYLFHALFIVKVLLQCNTCISTYSHAYF